MFDGPGFPKALDEEVFDGWLKDGRLQKIGYKYLLIVWDEYESSYRPVYAGDREDIQKYNTSNRDRLIAAYDLYSESRIV